jgi:hypothetical protein
VHFIPEEENDTFPIILMNISIKIFAEALDFGSVAVYLDQKNR